MNVLDSFKDIVKHTYGLGFFDTVKVMGTDKETKLEAIDADKTVVMFADLYQPIDGIDSTIGMTRLAILKSYTEIYKDFIPVIVKDAKTSTTPVEIEFKDNGDSVSTYRFMSELVVNEQVKIPPFKGATWNFSFKPEKKNIAQLNTHAGVLGAFEKRFTISVNNDVLSFSIGAGPTDRTTLAFAKGIKGTIKGGWSYPLAEFLAILKLADTSDAVIHVSDMGVMKIDIDSGMGKYSYIVPAGKA